MSTATKNRGGYFGPHTLTPKRITEGEHWQDVIAWDNLLTMFTLAEWEWIIARYPASFRNVQYLHGHASNELKRLAR